MPTTATDDVAASGAPANRCRRRRRSARRTNAGGRRGAKGTPPPPRPALLLLVVVVLLVRRQRGREGSPPIAAAFADAFSVVPVRLGFGRRTSSPSSPSRWAARARARTRPRPLPLPTSSTTSLPSSGGDSSSRGSGDICGRRANDLPLPLPSSYPTDVPPGLRGEAVRSALLASSNSNSNSGPSRCCCVGWNFSEGNGEGESESENPLHFGVVRVSGRGCARFLDGKLSRSFGPGPADAADDDSPSSSSGFRVRRGTFRDSCLLDAKGRIVDLLGVGSAGVDEAYVLTSPGHASRDLSEAWERLVFPFDEVGVDDVTSTEVFALASASIENVQAAFERRLLPALERELGIDVGELPRGGDLKLPQPEEEHFLAVDLFPSGRRDGDGDGDDDNNSSNCALRLLAFPTCHLPSCCAVGYTFAFVEGGGSSDSNGRGVGVGRRVWESLVADGDQAAEEAAVDVVEIGALEYENLRIESGRPAYGMEMVAASKSPSKSKTKSKEKSKGGAPAGDNEDDDGGDVEESEGSPGAVVSPPPSPLELHLDDCIDDEKGCYLGQEGVASIRKNPRGPPRTLCVAAFADDSNPYRHQEEEEGGTAGDAGGDRDGSELRNDTRLPRVGDALFALGSNGEIRVGTVTSVAEPGGTGSAETVALCLVRRPSSVAKQLEAMDLRIPQPPSPSSSSSSGSAAVINNDNSNKGGSDDVRQQFPLEGLEVIVGGTFTVGTLRAVPSQRFVRQHRGTARKNMFAVDDDDDDDDDFLAYPDKSTSEPAPAAKPASAAGAANIGDGVDALPEQQEKPRQEEEDLQQLGSDEEEELIRAAEKAQAEAEAAAAEAKRKADKMEMLRKRAEEAMARRKQKEKQKE